ncbi:DUF3575 domain-containing protein [Paracnuella aquatica]|uniref:DUF3575 domain-containing protein n=1 Tax=Paracnuella aquatica TaxID=2268757 RepID=UPI000DEEFA05|nr:DUF3575 domain-containing protein [Paracnuella aquatica]RPD50920.1 DUF3575 domain-containing protein [Paracnuella aquatica]
MKKICCVVLLLWALGAAAQKAPLGRPKYTPHNLVVTINPLAMFNADHRLMMGVEHRFSSRFSLVGDVGLVVQSSYLDEAKKARGFELRPALRYYYTRQGAGYVQGQLHYRLMNYDLHGWLGQNCVNGVPTYEKLQDFTFQKSQAGAAVVTGGTERLGKHWLLDVSVGLGLVYRQQKVKDEPNCCYMPTDNFFGNTTQNNMWLPVVPISVKLGYVIK